MSGEEQSLPGAKYSPDYVEKLVRAITENLPPRKIKKLSYEDVIKFHINEYPHEFGVDCGVCLKSKRGDHFSFIQAFLFSDDEIILRHDSRIKGRLLEVSSLDDELKDAFGDNDVLFLKSS